MRACFGLLLRGGERDALQRREAQRLGADARCVVSTHTSACASGIGASAELHSLTRERNMQRPSPRTRMTLNCSTTRAGRLRSASEKQHSRRRRISEGL